MIIENIYSYIDANGKPFEVVRTWPKGFYQRRPDGKGNYINDLKSIVPTLYHENKLKEAIDRSKPIYLVEGEKDTDRLRSLGLVATTNPMGAGKWRDNYSKALRGADLIIIPDNDKPGRAHANHIAKLCYGIARRIRVLMLPSDSKDASDWLEKGHTADELKLLADTSPDYEPSNNGIKLRRMAEVENKTYIKNPDREIIQTIKERIHLADVIEWYTEITYSNTDQMKFRCTLHGTDTSPSGVIYTKEQKWWCFGCNKGGDAFDAIQAFERIDLPTAIKKLANHLGIELRPLKENNKRMGINV